MRKYLLSFLLFVYGVFWWSRFVSSGRLLKQAEAHPNLRGTATVLFVVASYYDVFERPGKAGPHYKMIANLYPRSRYGAKARYGLANCLEREMRYAEALVEYEKFLKDYPKDEFSASVEKNIGFLRSR
ncbi:MAG: hypothetical protein HY548_02720 [Elusimicrobia bacterium]|nr:hypothetical protein [Elusimicrobiota bacterium]